MSHQTFIHANLYFSVLFPVYTHVDTKYEEDGNASDTPTDILCGVPIIDKQLTQSWIHTRPRSGSVCSDDSNHSYSDTEEKIRESVRRRSKSADGRGIFFNPIERHNYKNMENQCYL